MLNIIRMYKSKIIRYVIIGFIGCLFIVQLPYWIGEIKVIIKTDFSAGDILSFLGDYISAIGTILLGWIAVKQTEMANNISERVAKLEVAKHKEEHEPVVVIDWVKLHDFSYNRKACKADFDGQLHYIDAKYENDINEERQCIEIKFINTGKSGIYNCKLEKVNSQPEELKRSTISLGVTDRPFVLKVGEELKFNLFVYPNVVERFAVREIKKLQLEFSCVNDFNEKYKLVFDIEGTVKFMGNNRCEGQLTPCPHPVKWEFRIDNEDACN